MCFWIDLLIGLEKEDENQGLPPTPRVADSESESLKFPCIQGTFCPFCTMYR